MARTALTDDSYITLSYARNLALHEQWALVEGISANTATSPLNVWLLAALTFLLHAPVLAAGILLVATTAATALGLHALARDTGLNSWLVPGLGVAVLLTCPLLNSTVGLETYLAVALMVWLVRSALFGGWLGVGMLAGLLVLARPDLVLVDVAVVALAAGWRRQLWWPLGALVLGAAVALPWHAFTWVVVRIGHLGQAAGLGHYLERWTLATSLTLPVLVLGLAALVAWVGVAAWQRRLAPAGAAAITLAVGGLADYAGLSALQVAPFFWYYGPVLAGLGLCAVVTAAALMRRAPAPGRTAVAGRRRGGRARWRLRRGPRGPLGGHGSGSDQLGHSGRVPGHRRRAPPWSCRRVARRGRHDRVLLQLPGRRLPRRPGADAALRRGVSRPASWPALVVELRPLQPAGAGAGDLARGLRADRTRRTRSVAHHFPCRPHQADAPGVEVKSANPHGADRNQEDRRSGRSLRCDLLRVGAGLQLDHPISSDGHRFAAGLPIRCLFSTTLSRPRREVSQAVAFIWYDSRQVDELTYRGVGPGARLGDDRTAVGAARMVPAPVTVAPRGPAPRRLPRPFKKVG